MTSIAASKSSMIIDGIAASEAIDSSGEILDVKGCDISDFENGVGVLNYEHRGDEAQGASGNDIVGKIIFAKKIYKKEDCDDKRQEAYWDSVKLPFVYIRGRLYDGAGHPGALALAAIIRDAVMHNEPILARFSIEGSTLKKEGQHLRKTIARKVAVTLKPANKSAISGLISDPNAPKPITQKQGDKSLLDQILETAKKEEPGKQVIGGHSHLYKNLEMEADATAVLKMTAQNLRSLIKAMEAGQGGGAPSTLTGGAALQREDDRLHRTFDRNTLKSTLRAAVRDMPDSARVSKAAMTQFFKFKLPEVNEQFIDHFTDLIDDIRTRNISNSKVDKSIATFKSEPKPEVKLDIKKPEPKADLTERVKKLTEKLTTKTQPAPEPDPEPVAKAVKPDLREETIRSVERMAIDLANLAKEEAFHAAQPGVVHSDIHVPQHYVVNDEQKSMVHGMNLNESDAPWPEHSDGVKVGSVGSNGMWYHLPDKSLAFAKNSDYESVMPSEAHAEVLYHNFLHKTGLGKYIMPTTLVRHPDAPVGDDNSKHYHMVQKAVPNARHWSGPEHDERLYDLAKSGELQKLALVNNLMKNRDRHDWNFLFGGKEGKDFYLIDHGSTLNHYTNDNFVSGYPAYMAMAHNHAIRHNLPFGELHPDVKKWVEKLNPEELKSFFDSHKTPDSVSHGVLMRLKHMQDYLKDEPDAKFDEIWHAPNLAEGQPSGGGIQQSVLERSKKDPGAWARYQKRVENRETTRLARRAATDNHRQNWMDTLDQYISHMVQGEDPNPYELLKQRVGPEQAETLLRPIAGPQNIDQYIKDFNDAVRTDASRKFRHAHLTRTTMAHKLWVAERQGALPTSILAAFKDKGLDDAASEMHAPLRGNKSDDEYRQAIVEWLKPHAVKIRNIAR